MPRESIGSHFSRRAIIRDAGFIGDIDRYCRCRAYFHLLINAEFSPPVLGFRDDNAPERMPLR